MFGLNTILTVDTKKNRKSVSILKYWLLYYLCRVWNYNFLIIFYIVDAVVGPIAYTCTCLQTIITSLLLGVFECAPLCVH